VPDLDYVWASRLQSLDQEAAVPHPCADLSAGRRVQYLHLGAHQIPAAGRRHRAANLYRGNTLGGSRLSVNEGEGRAKAGCAQETRKSTAVSRAHCAIAVSLYPARAPHVRHVART
jgi:hypothetical protein